MQIAVSILMWLGNALLVSAFVYAFLYAMSPTIRGETWGSVYLYVFSWWWPRLVKFIQDKMPKKKAAAPPINPKYAWKLMDLVKEHGENSIQVKNYLEEHPECAVFLEKEEIEPPVEEIVANPDTVKGEPVPTEASPE